MEQIIKFGISNYLQLCVEAGFSQIQSHIMNDIGRGSFNYYILLIWFTLIFQVHSATLSNYLEASQLCNKSKVKSCEKQDSI